MSKKTYVFTDLAVSDLLGRYDELISSCKSEEELETELGVFLSDPILGIWLHQRN